MIASVHTSSHPDTRCELKLIYNLEVPYSKIDNCEDRKFIILFIFIYVVVFYVCNLKFVIAPFLLFLAAVSGAKDTGCASFPNLTLPTPILLI